MQRFVMMFEPPTILHTMVTAGSAKRPAVIRSKDFVWASLLEMLNLIKRKKKKLNDQFNFTKNSRKIHERKKFAEND